jgi:hypothetical protein
MVYGRYRAKGDSASALERPASDQGHNMICSTLTFNENAAPLGFDRLAAPLDAGARRRTEEIRWRMLNEAGAAHTDSKSLLMHRMIFSDDPQLLWDLRGDLLGMVTEVRGANEANRRLARITSLFAGLPAGQGSAALF